MSKTNIKHKVIIFINSISDWVEYNKETAFILFMYWGDNIRNTIKVIF